MAVQTKPISTLTRIKLIKGRRDVDALEAGDVVMVGTDRTLRCVAVYEGQLSDGRYSFLSMATSGSLKGELTNFVTTREYIYQFDNGILLSPFHTEVHRHPSYSLQNAAKRDIVRRAGLA